MHARLHAFVDAVEVAVAQDLTEAALLEQVGAQLAQLVSQDDWLPEAQAKGHPQFYRQYPLFIDPQARFSVVSFVWGPGHATPVHDHTVWGLIGMLRGSEISQPFGFDAAGKLQPQGDAVRLLPGQVEAVSPRIGDIHRVHNAWVDQVSISIHVYGADIGKVQRWVYAPDGSRKPFVSGYSEP